MDRNPNDFKSLAIRSAMTPHTTRTYWNVLKINRKTSI